MPTILTAHLHIRGAEVQTLYKLSERDDVVFDTGFLPTAWAYVGLGHIHKPQCLGGMEHVRYPGSLDRLHFDERDDEKGVVLLDLGPTGLNQEPAWIPIAPTPMLDVHVADAAELCSIPERYPDRERAIARIRVTHGPAGPSRHEISLQLRALFPRHSEITWLRPEAPGWSREPGRVRAGGRLPHDDPQLPREGVGWRPGQGRGHGARRAIPGPGGRIMIPKRIELENFLELRDAGRSVRVHRRRAALGVCGRNGVGKSAVFDGITYALYGEHRGGSQKADQLIRHGANGFRIVLEFEFAGVDYRITRIRAGRTAQQRSGRTAQKSSTASTATGRRCPASIRRTTSRRGSRGRSDSGTRLSRPPCCSAKAKPISCSPPAGTSGSRSSKGSSVSSGSRRYRRGSTRPRKATPRVSIRCAASSVRGGGHARGDGGLGGGGRSR